MHDHEVVAIYIVFFMHILSSIQKQYIELLATVPMHTASVSNQITFLSYHGIIASSYVHL